MSPRAHPSDETLLRFAAGRLAAGPRRVVAAHLEGCPHCRAQVGLFEAVGGALLDAQAPPDPEATLAADALDRLFERIDGAAPDAAPARSSMPRSVAPVPPRGLPDGMAWPASLAGCAVSSLWPVGPGMRVGRVRVPEDPSATVLLLRIAPGRGIPDHTHGGQEYTQVLCGTFHDGVGRYGPGDLVEADGALHHAPVVDAPQDCVCLVALDGPLRFRGLLGRVLGPFL